MGHPNAEQVANRALQLGLLTERQLQEIWASLGSRNAPLNELLQLLVRREYLTNYQVERLVKGERSGFFFGRYRVLYLMGAGSFARVYRAEHRDTGEIVAVKVLRNRYSDNPEQASQFIREGRVGIALRHPNIVPIYDVVSEGKQHFLVMEFVEGWNLRDFVRIRKKIEPLQATRLTIDIAEGLRYAFDNGLTHRDLKLSNVLITSSGQAKLVDFGLAAMGENFADEVTTEQLSARTIDYAALERATGVRKDDTRSDIYFLGCIYYHMLTGQAPLQEMKDRLQRLSKARFMDVVPIQQHDPTMSHWVVMVVNRAMAIDPAKRYQTPAAMLADLATVEAQLLEEAKTGKSSPAARVAPEGNQKKQSIMVVESNQRLQDVFRDGFKRVGYRVLVIGDADRAVARFRQDHSVVDAVVFSAQELGESALDGFNVLGEDGKTKFVKAVLLLGENQKEWQSRVFLAKHRVVLTMPITMKELRQTMATLLEEK